MCLAVGTLQSCVVVGARCMLERLRAFVIGTLDDENGNRERRKESRKVPDCRES